MTNQEAINIIKTAIAQVEWDYPMECAAALDKAIEALEKREAPDNGGWISVKDRLPEEDGKYLCVWQGMSIETGLFINGHFRLYGEIKDKLVTHWMPMPEPPKEEA